MPHCGISTFVGEHGFRASLRLKPRDTTFVSATSRTKVPAMSRTKVSE